ncbi:MAG TPA: type II toxin-antitoxin system VapC family toxin [Chiayiivirga sp.]|nr:type II toxin-antitoxin system VapC family toxin [Chiayiivirga sp.]HRP71897.1 type II toxin-antitoxin system VapC family toxin [Luteimonas sp.]
MILFLDANALIYLIEGAEPFASRVRRQLQALTADHPGMPVAVSRLTALECRTGPMKAQDVTLLSDYDAFFARPDLVWVELDATVIDLATAIRARHGLKTPDALQAACCLQLGPDHVFVTGDKAFARVAGLNVAVLR